MAAQILIADDDPVQRRLLEAHVARMGHRAIAVAGGEAALTVLRAGAESGAGSGVAAVILDLMMPGTGGLAVLEEMRRAGLDVPVVVQTAMGGTDTVVEAMRAGAFDFVVKPASFEKLHAAIDHALRVAKARRGPQGRRRKPQAGSIDLRRPTSPAMREVLRAAERASGSAIPILIQGETGVGKEWLAQAIRLAGPRAKAPFVAVNCGALPSELAESILFGHEQGAFTGATERRMGRFLEADGGTLFLDEVGELSPAVQVKLLRTLQSGEVDVVGGRAPVRTDVRIISATNRDLAEDVRTGRFRGDLSYRLDVFPIAIPPLRERREEIADLSDLFLRRFVASNGRAVRGFSPAARALLAAYDWPGNIRQLENVVHRAVVLAEGSILEPRDFPQVLAFARPGAEDQRDQAMPDAAQDMMAGEPPCAAVGLPCDGSTAVLQAGSGRAGSLPALDAFDGAGLLRRLEDVEADLIRVALAHCDGGPSEIAQRLGIGRSTLYRKIRDLGLA